MAKVNPVGNKPETRKRISRTLRESAIRREAMRALELALRLLAAHEDSLNA